MMENYSRWKEKRKEDERKEIEKEKRLRKRELKKKTLLEKIKKREKTGRQEDDGTRRREDGNGMKDMKLGRLVTVWRNCKNEEKENIPR
jgi:hypothetical protein